MEHEANGSSWVRAGGQNPTSRARGRRESALRAAALLVAAVLVESWGREGVAQPDGGQGDAAASALAATEGRSGVASSVTSASGGVLTARCLPGTRSGLLPEVGAKLYEAFGLATERVQRVEQCRALFVRLGGDGADRLHRTLYYPPTPEALATRCSRGALAATMVGSSATLLCPAFGRLSARQAAAVLIHEALHFAGLPERPHDPAANSSTEITNLVKGSCGL
jgi:hypothetical protein